MAKHRRLRIDFPFGGLDRSGPYRQQPPFTTTDMQNMRAFGTAEGRRRGGSRGGLVESHRTDLGGPVRMLHNMQLIVSDGFKTWSDNFDGSSLGDAWTLPSWATDLPNVLPSNLSAIDYSTSEGAALRDPISDLDTASAYVIELWLIPWDGEWHGSYSLYLRMDNSSPAYATEGVEIKLTMSGSSGNITAELNSYLASAKTVTDSDTIAFTAASPGWLTAHVSGDVVTVYFQGTQILTGTVDTHTGTRVAYGLECTVDGGLALCNTFRAQYYSTEVIPRSRTLLVASASGNFFYEEFYGVMTQLTTNLSLRDDVRLSTAQGGQLLYIGDYGVAESGTDGTVSGTTLDAASVSDWTAIGANIYDYVAVLDNVLGSTTAGVYAISAIAAGSVTLASAPGDGTCSFRIERMIKVYDHAAGTLSLLTATAGIIESGNHLLTRYLDRLFIGGTDKAPNAWFASEQTDYTNWDYTVDSVQRAIYGPTSEQGLPGQPLTAFAATSDDYLIIFGSTEMWRMRGDPAYGGSLDRLSENVGCVDSHAWCHGPAGEVIVLTRDGLYIVPPGGDTFPVSMSREALPREMRNLDMEQLEAQLEYDVQGRGIHIMLTPDDSNDRVHMWFDWDTKTYYPMTYQSAHEPTAMCSVQSTAVEASGVILGCRDGKLRTFNDLAHNDCGTAFVAYVMMGPVAYMADEGMGSLVVLEIELSANSSDATWGWLTADTFEDVSSATPVATGTVTGGLNYTLRPSGRGKAFALKLTNVAHTGFQIEDVQVITRHAGPRRKL
jgi:hypothetical protein